MLGARGEEMRSPKGLYIADLITRIPYEVLRRGVWMRWRYLLAHRYVYGVVTGGARGMGRGL